MDGSDQQLKLLRAAVEGGLDGMVIVSRDGTMIAHNHQFEQMWPIPADVIASGSDAAALQSVLDKLVDPAAFLSRVHALYDQGSGDARDELLLRDGRVFDRYGKALRDGSSYLGWAWYFRDVTVERAAARRYFEDSERFAALAADAARMAELVAVAQALADARSETEVLEVVTRRGAAVLGAAGVVLCLTDPDGKQVRALTTAFFDDEVRSAVAQLPVDSALPMVDAAVTGAAHFLYDRAAAVRLFPGSEDLYVRARTDGSAAVSLRVHGVAFGSLSVAFESPHRWRAADRELLEALASLTAQSLDRMQARQNEQAATSATRRLSESLQRSLLSAPPVSEHHHVAVRYQPAAQEAQVGGDWYDAFFTPHAGLTLTVGDVAGHDRDAAAAMAQVRNLLRGIAQTLDAPPAAVLSALDRALLGLQVPALATAVVCHARRAEVGGGSVLRWSNAGHPPPLLLHADGRVELLSREPNLLLGLAPDCLRHDHEVELAAGSVIVLYTDGLVERRAESLDDSLERLLSTAAELRHLSPEPLCEALLERLAVGSEDDVALLVLRIGNQAQPSG